jgi:hypothetical protein
MSIVDSVIRRRAGDRKQLVVMVKFLNVDKRSSGPSVARFSHLIGS